MTDYWLQAGRPVFVTTGGTRETLPLGQVDFRMTARLNQERGVALVLRCKPE